MRRTSPSRYATPPNRKELGTASSWWTPASRIRWCPAPAWRPSHGKPSGRPYFGIDGKPLSPSCWAKMRAKFHCEVGITNVWRVPQASGAERIQGTRTGMKYKFASLHGSQKPLKFIDRIVRACTNPGDMVWEPFGGLCPGAVVATNSAGATEPRRSTASSTTPRKRDWRPHERCPGRSPQARPRRHLRRWEAQGPRGGGQQGVRGDGSHTRGR